MSTFSPYSYRLTQFSDDISSSLLKDINSYYNVYTFLGKPSITSNSSRNVYKVSLAQMLHYLVDFGIGYNSVCTSIVTKQQQFSSGKYVNRHKTDNTNRPATVADLKDKILSVINDMINVVVHCERTGIQKTDILYPKYIFTLDTDPNVSTKIKQLSNQDYSEVTSFSDFAYTSTDGYAMPNYTNGYVPAELTLSCPKHNHGYNLNSNLSKSMSYSYRAVVGHNGNIMWKTHCGICPINYWTKYHQDTTFPLCMIDGVQFSSYTASDTASWEFPTGISCFENNEIYSNNYIKEIDSVSIRFPGRRYRLFKLNSNTTIIDEPTKSTEKFSIDKIVQLYKSASTSDTLYVTSSKRWTVTSDCPWIVVKTTSGNAGTNVAIKFDILENLSISDRSGNISVTSNGKVLKFSVIQRGAISSITFNEPSRTFDYKDSLTGKILKVITSDPNISWTASSSASWIKITSKTSKGVGTGNVEYDISVNNSISSRTGTINITGADQTVQFIIIQNMAPATLSISESSKIISNNDNNDKVLTVTSNTSWIAKSNSSWITIIDSTNNGNGTIIYRLSKNNSSTERKGTITINSTSGLTATFNITQSATSVTTKERDFNKYIIYPYRPVACRDYSTRNLIDTKLDLGLGGDVFASANPHLRTRGELGTAGNISNYWYIPGECRTWLLIDGNSEFRGDAAHHAYDDNLTDKDYAKPFWWEWAAPTRKNMLKYLEQYFKNEHLGIIIDTEGQNMSGDNFYNTRKFYKIIKDTVEEFRKKIGRKRIPIIAFPCPGTAGFPDGQMDKINYIFDAAVFWKYTYGANAMMNVVKDWHNHGFKKQIAINQDQYKTGDYTGASNWKDYANTAINETKNAKQAYQIVPFSTYQLDGKCMKWDLKGSNGITALRNALLDIYKKAWPNPPSPNG